MKSIPSIWGLDTDVCIHLVLSTHKYCRYFAILCQPPHSEKCFISDNICSQNSPKRSLTRFPRASSTCVYLRSHLLLTSSSTNLGIYTHLNLRQNFKILILTLFCYKWTVTELYEDKEIERDQFKMVIVRVTTLKRIIRTGQQWIQIFVQIWLTSILDIQTYVFIHTEQQFTCMFIFMIISVPTHLHGPKIREGWQRNGKRSVRLARRGVTNERLPDVKV